MAAGILLGIVMAVTSAITAGQQHALEAQNRIAGAIAAEELLSRIISVPYADLATWNGYGETPGEMTDAVGGAMPSAFNHVGRAVSVATEVREFAELDVTIKGRLVTVQAIDTANELLAELSHFVPQPAEETYEEGGEEEEEAESLGGGGGLGGLLGGGGGR